MSSSKARPRDIALAVGVGVDEVYDWRRRVRNPRLSDIGRISMALGLGPWELAAKMGIVPQDAAAIARVAELTRVVDDLEQQERDLYARVYGSNGDRLVAHIVEQAAASRRWAVAVWPAVEGPPDCQIRVADRLDFRRTDGEPAHIDDLVRDLGESLHLAGAVEGTAPPRWADVADADPSVLHLAISRFTRKRPLAVSDQHPRVRSVAVVGLTADSWATDTASAIAYALGYGLLGTREMVGAYVGDDARRDALVTIRRDLHEHLLSTPPSRKVWAHVAVRASAEGLLPALDAPWPSGLVVVWVRESDELLALRPGNATLHQRQQGRDATDELAQAHISNGAPLVIINSERPPDYWPGGSAGAASADLGQLLRGRAQRMTDALNAAHRFLVDAVAAGWLDSVVPAHDAVDDENGELVRRWLSTRTSAT